MRGKTHPEALCCSLHCRRQRWNGWTQSPAEADTMRIPLRASNKTNGKAKILFIRASWEKGRLARGVSV